MAIGECLQEDHYTRMPIGECLPPMLAGAEQQFVYYEVHIIINKMLLSNEFIPSSRDRPHLKAQ